MRLVDHNKCLVYFIYDGEFTKIGVTSRSVEQRIRELQSPREITCLGTIFGGKRLEKQIHLALADRHARGEWFHGLITPDDAQEALARDAEKSQLQPTQFKRHTKEGALRRKTNGYVLVYAPNNPMAMASNGYVLEHRLVMAEHLGRPLVTDECVYHINKVKDDNRLENLRLEVARVGAFRFVSYEPTVT